MIKIYYLSVALVVIALIVNGLFIFSNLDKLALVKDGCQLVPSGEPADYYSAKEGNSVMAVYLDCPPK